MLLYCSTWMTVIRATITLKDDVVVVTSTRCCCWMIYISLHPRFPHLSIPCSFSVVFPHEYWVAHKIFIAHAHTTYSPLLLLHTHRHTSLHMDSNKGTVRTRPQPFCLMCLNACIHTYKYEAAVIHMLRRKERVQTKWPWNFNTQSVLRIHQQTHTESCVCMGTESPHLFFNSHP